VGLFLERQQTFFKTLLKDGFAWLAVVNLDKLRGIRLLQDNSSAATQESTTNIQAGIFSPGGNQLQCPASCEMEQPTDQQLFSPHRMPIRQLETLQLSSQSSRQMDSQLPTLSHFNQTSNGNIEQCHDSQVCWN